MTFIVPWSSSTGLYSKGRLRIGELLPSYKTLGTVLKAHSPLLSIE